ncbi:MAG: hypothetical protein AB8B57_06495 [Congregibacter sp.]
MRAVIFGIVVLFATTACSWTEIKFGSKKPQMSWVTVTDSGAVQAGILLEKDLPAGTELLGYVVTWPAEFNAAFVGPKGTGCIQPAAFMTTSSGDITLPAQVLAGGIASGDITAGYDTSVTELLKISDEQTRLSIGMYGICQLVVAGGLTQEQASDAIQLLLQRPMPTQED